MTEGLTVAVATVDDRPELVRLRAEVFVTEQGVPVEIEQDAGDLDAVHVVARLDGTVVGTGRLVRTDDAVVGHLGRMAVAAGARGAGTGAALLRVLEREGHRLGLHRIELHAQVHAAGFYARAGYAEDGPHYLEAGIDHVTMVKALPVRREARDADSEALIELISSCFAEYPGCVMDVDGEEPWLRRPASAYTEAHGTLWVFGLGGPEEPVVACGGMKSVAPGRYELKNLYVGAPARRHGLGGELTELVEDTARALGGTVLQLWTDTRFTDAHRLYERHGYLRRPQTRELHDLSNTTEFFYEKSLDGS